MKQKLLSIIVCSSLGLAAGAVCAGEPSAQTGKPTRAEIQQKAMQDGPASSQFGYVTYKAPAGLHHAAAAVDPKLLRPLTQREMGMLYNACIAYPECMTAYSSAREHEQALLRAQEAKNDPRQ